MIFDLKVLATWVAIFSTASAVPTSVSISVSIYRNEPPKAQYCDVKKYYIKPDCKLLYGPAWFETFNPQRWPLSPYFTCCYIYDVPPPPGPPEPPEEPKDPEDPEDPKEPEEPEEPEDPDEPDEPEPEEPEDPEDPEDPPEDPEDPEKDSLNRTHMKVLGRHTKNRYRKVLKKHPKKEHASSWTRTSDLIIEL